MPVVDFATSRIKGLTSNEESSTATPKHMRADRIGNLYIDSHSVPSHRLAVQYVEIFEETLIVHPAVNQQIPLGKKLSSVSRSWTWNWAILCDNFKLSSSELEKLVAKLNLQILTPMGYSPPQR